MLSTSLDDLFCHMVRLPSQKNNETHKFDGMITEEKSSQETKTCERSSGGLKKKFNFLLSLDIRHVMKFLKVDEKWGTIIKA